MTVKELMEILKNYDENAQVILKGGECEDGAWAELRVENGKTNTGYYNGQYDKIMEYEE